MISALRAFNRRLADAFFGRPAARLRREAILTALAGGGMDGGEIARAVGRPHGTLYADLAHLERVDRLIASEKRTPFTIFEPPPPARTMYFLADPERPTA